MNKKGFTLVELLATFAVLGIVITITIVSMGDIFKNTKAKTEDAFVDTIEDAIEMYLSSDAKNLNFSNVCTKKLNKSFGDRNVYSKTITFNNIINSSYKPIKEDEFINPADENAICNKNAVITIYRDEDYVYYYSVNKSSFTCLKNSGVITNLPVLENGESYKCN